MRGLHGWRIATIRGVDLKVHISLLLLLLYVVFVAALQFPLVVQQSGIDPTSVSGGPVAWAIVFAFSLLVSVAVHEFGHVFVAQAQGVEVKGVSLMMLGGASEMERIPDRKYAEFKLAVIGPIVSLAIGAILLGLGRLTTSPSLDLFCYWVGRVNIALGVFNLLPAFPLDGGRALRSLMAVRQGQMRATQNAVRVSKVFAWVMGILGFLSLNLLLMLIAFFVYSLANAELVLQFSRKLLAGLKAGDV